MLSTYYCYYYYYYLLLLEGGGATKLVSSVCVQLSMYTDNVALPPLHLPGPQQQTYSHAVQWADGTDKRIDGQTDGQTDR